MSPKSKEVVVIVGIDSCYSTGITFDTNINAYVEDWVFDGRASLINLLVGIILFALKQSKASGGCLRIVAHTPNAPMPLRLGRFTLSISSSLRIGSSNYTPILPPLGTFH